MDIEEGPRLVPGEYLLEMLDQGGRGNNDGERSKGVTDLTGPNVLDQCTIKNWMKKPGDEAKHRIPQSLACFRPHQLAIAIHTAPITIDESHRVAAHRALRRWAFVNDREFGQFKVVGHGTIFPLFPRFHFQ